MERLNGTRLSFGAARAAVTVDMISFSGTISRARALPLSIITCRRELMAAREPLPVHL